MEGRDREDEKNKRIGWLTSIGTQLLLIVIFYFIIAWKEPFPPIPEYGIELGFTTSAGAPSTSSPFQESSEIEEEFEEVIEEIDDLEQEEVADEQTEIEPTEQQPITPSQEDSPTQVEEVEANPE
ncbi:MAG: hypothetical protein AAFY41_16640, partial [Bacteroidota bacterium]